MNKIIICLTIFLVIHLSYADEQLNTETINQHQLVESSSATQSQDYISRGNYIQNPYIGMPSAGGTQELSESDFSRDNIAKKWFAILECQALAEHKN